MAIQALLVILAVLLVLLFLGVPISYAIAVSSLTAILSSIDLNVAVLTAAQRTFVGMSKFSLTAIPFFILAGNIMNQAASPSVWWISSWPFWASCPAHCW